jgi:hypothetical protein
MRGEKGKALGSGVWFMSIGKEFSGALMYITRIFKTTSARGLVLGVKY